MSYTEENGCIVGRNGLYFNNRPLYGDHRSSVTMAGDRPHIRFTNKPIVFGCMTLAVQRGDKACWLHDAADITSRYRPGRLAWEIRDPCIEGLTLRVEVLSLAETEGFSVKLTSEGVQTGDRLTWAFGGSVGTTDASKAFDPVADAPSATNPNPKSPVVSKRFLPEDCRDTRIDISGDRFLLSTSDTHRNVAGRCTSGELTLADASAWDEVLHLFDTPADSLPLACGRLELSDGDETYWAAETLDEGICESPACDDPAGVFAAAQDRVEKVARQVVVETPDPQFNTGVSAACYAMDSMFYPPVYVHGAMGWNIPFPGWRSFYGATAFGWHDNVTTEAKHYIATQNTETEDRAAEADENRRLCTQGKASHFYGRGRIQKDADPYNFQTQFFDQLVHAWRATADPDLAAVLRKGLQLHLEWQRECFDPDDDGLYESYINSWPTDSVWQNGGGSADETAYAYAGQRGAADLATAAGDDAGAAAHSAQANKILDALLKELWLPGKGHVAQYKEQGGLERVHEDAWLNTVVLPIESGLLDIEQAVQALHYAEWALENVSMPFGGRRVWSSNWVPCPWSARELHPGDNYALALAYFRTGLADDGWDVLQGNYLESMYHGPVPGALASASTGTDFADIVSPFCRCVVEGLFGYRPDYPNGSVTISPQFPSHWGNASITTPDVSIDFREIDGEQRWSLSLARPARVLLIVPLCATSVTSVEANGQPAAWTVDPGFGCSRIIVEAETGSNTDVILKYEPVANSEDESMELAVDVGENIVLQTGSNPITAFRDPQALLINAQLEAGRLRAEIAANPGHHLLLAEVQVGTLPQWRRFKFCISDPESEAREAAQVAPTPDARATFHCLDVSDELNADIRRIYQQEYRSPRPDTCSLRIGIDGYSPWTFAFWKTPVPDVDLSKVPDLLDPAGRLQTPQGVPFTWPGEEHNIAFASHWDNWPNEVVIPLNRSGSSAWFLLCGTTNPMQCRIANARLRLSYADGVTENLDIVPPNNFWTLCHLGGSDYNYERDAFAMPAVPPPTVQLGDNCRAVLLGTRLRPGVELKDVTLEALSQEVVIGVMGITFEG
jgi:hypothetical protein